MQTDNMTAHGVVTNNITRKRLKSIDMPLRWLRCRATQEKLRHYWRVGETNLGDYVTKHHAETNHRTVRPIYLTSKNQLNLLRKKTKIKENELRNKTAARVS